MLSKKTTFAALAAVAVLGVARFGMADTISVHSNPNNASSVTLITDHSSPYYGDDQYTYDVDFDTSANVIKPGDGFSVIDFGTLAGYTLTGPNTVAINQLISDFTAAGDMTTPLDITTGGLSGAGAYGPNTDNFSDSVSGNTSHPTDLSYVKNVQFNYSGAGFTTATTVDLTLELYTTNLSAPTFGNGIGVDHSGASLTSTPGLSFALNNLLVPTPIPLPMSGVLGGAMLSLVGLGYSLKPRKVQA